jgi:hypothetical protein
MTCSAKLAILIDLKVEKAPRGDGGEGPRPRPQPTDPSEVSETVTNSS